MDRVDRLYAYLPTKKETRFKPVGTDPFFAQDAAHDVFAYGGEDGQPVTRTGVDYRPLPDAVALQAPNTLLTRLAQIPLSILGEWGQIWLLTTAGEWLNPYAVAAPG